MFSQEVFTKHLVYAGHHARNGDTEVNKSFCFMIMLSGRKQTIKQAENYTNMYSASNSH